MRSAALALALAACDNPTRLAGEAVVMVSDAAGGAAFADELVWTGVLAYGFGDLDGEILESAIVGVMADPCAPRLDIRFAGEPRTHTVALPAGGTIVVRRGGGSPCPQEPELRWGATAGTLTITLDDDVVAASFTGVTMAPLTPAATGTFTIARSAAAVDYR